MMIMQIKYFFYSKCLQRLLNQELKINIEKNQINTILHFTK